MSQQLKVPEGIWLTSSWYGEGSGPRWTDHCEQNHTRVKIDGMVSAHPAHDFLLGCLFDT